MLSSTYKRYKLSNFMPNRGPSGTASGYFERTNKRSPYVKSGYMEEYEARASEGGLGYALLTFVCLAVLYPIGLVMLWSHKLRFSTGLKLLATFASAVIFCMLLVFAANVETDDPRIGSLQNRLNVAFDWIYDHTNDALNNAAAGAGSLADRYAEKAVYVWDGVKVNAAKAGVELLGDKAQSVAQVKQKLPEALLAVFKHYMGYTEPPKQEAPKTQNPLAGIVVTTPEPSPAKMLSATPIPTLAPTPEPTPTPVPVTMPEIRDVAEAPVYYTPGGTYYHLTRNCSGMLNASSHTLKEAKDAGKQMCANCGVVPVTMMDRKDKDYLWVDAKNVAHTSDICRDFFQGTYKVIPFEDVYKGHYTYCPKCRADSVFEYMRQKDAAFNVSDGDIDPATRLVYEYEKTVTVYYSQTSRYYHSSQDCQQMYDDKYVHSLFEALHQDGKNPCPVCDPFNEADVRERFANK
ncbi:MAG: hypothetical protein II912_04185 [Clostridia bacterium]|nr:hypothetical protein [Clostridia bacterium]